MKRAVGLTVMLLVASWTLAGSAQKSQAPAKPAEAADPTANAETLSVSFANSVPSEDRKNLEGYKATLAGKTKQRWLQAKPPSSMSAAVRITCWVHTDGRVTGMTLESRSGNAALDRAAMAAITGSAPYDAFPYGIAVDQVRMRFTFSYNGAEPTVSKGSSTTSPAGAKSSATNPNPSSGSPQPVGARRPQ